MKNRIIALVVGMILLLFSSLTAQAPDKMWKQTVSESNEGVQGFKNWHLNFGIGYYWLYVQNRKSWAHKIEYADTLFYKITFRIQDTKHAGVFAEIGASKDRFSILASYKNWNSELIEEDVEEGVTPLFTQDLSVNSFLIRGSYCYDFIEKYASVSFILGGGIGWGEFNRQFLGPTLITEEYQYEPSFCSGTGITISILRRMRIHCTGEYEMLHFNGNPSFILDNWTIKWGMRLVI